MNLIYGSSPEEAYKLLQLHSDIAVILLDIVMENDSAGLNCTRYIRDVMQNKTVRIILRTGQSGKSHIRDVIRLYDINGYLEKSKLTTQDFEIAMITALRSYDDICTIGHLSVTNDALESLIKARTDDLYNTNNLLQEKIKEQAIAHRRLQLNEARLAEAQRIARIGHFEWSIFDDTVLLSDQLCLILNMPASYANHTLAEFIELVHCEDKTLVLATINKAIKEKKSYDIEHRLLHSKGATWFVRHQGDVTLNAAQQVTYIVGTLQDITERRLAEMEMRKLSTAVEQAADGIMITNSMGVIEYVNTAMLNMTGYDKSELLGATPRILKSEKQSAAFYKRLWKTIQQGKVFNEIVINKHKTGRLYFEEKTITPQKNNQGVIVNYISCGKDITERMEAQERLQHLAHHDALTGLPNKLLFKDRLEQAIGRAQWKETIIAVLFIDMDRFKIINDTLGHNIGDLLLQEMAVRLVACLRKNDTVARFGGDEFAIILNDIATKEDVIKQVDTILSKLAVMFECDSRELFVTASIGISLFPEDGVNTQTLLQKADAAMYLAKSKGRNAFQFYAIKDEQRAIDRLSLELSLRRALERDEFRLFYQPQLNLSNCKIEGYEALLRWQHPELGLVSPINFIPILEETGMIIPVGEWVLRTACEQEQSNRDMGFSPKKVAVNISIRQFKQKNFVQMVECILATTGLDPHYLELEVTENLLIDNMKETSKKLQLLHHMGLSFSIDDFGTGYSSMNYLRRLPFELLKIDRSFIMDITSSHDDAAIVTAMITLAHSMGVAVIAEGVETIEQLSFLDNLGCDSIQGFLCSPPLPMKAFNALEVDQYHNWKEYLIHCER
ncbi:EAL domain-containing protein [Psychromonas antarctica]|uniref:two-component system response regulator n=1 Tax=Psychromonas antarctica TaxID=67573 RepID=UPI001EE923CD|nr:EAL domain-containing protein [Psychromonas antarctica]MCG6201664.1 EAL domain-containing protein [Psychromonas antarctica]